MKKSRITKNPHKGFTLIELMIVVGIIGLLASTAIPYFFKVILDAKKAEIPILLSDLTRGEVSFFMRPRIANDGTELTACYLTLGAPPPTVNMTKHLLAPQLNQDVIGFHVTGEVYCNYGVSHTIPTQADPFITGDVALLCVFPTTVIAPYTPGTTYAYATALCNFDPPSTDFMGSSIPDYTFFTRSLGTAVGNASEPVVGDMAESDD